MRKPCEYCGQDLPEGTDKKTRQIRSAHFEEHAEERRILESCKKSMGDLVAAWNLEPPFAHPWVGCGECDVSFSCHNGESRCIRLPKQQT